MKFLIIIAAVLAVLFLLVRYLEKHSIFYPSTEMTMTPDRMGLEYKEINVTTNDGAKVNAWYVPVKNSEAILIFAHGNAGNMSSRIGRLKYFYDLGISSIVFDYRGYGRSVGVPTEKGVYRDAAAIYDFVKAQPELKDKSVIAYGGSLGGAVMINLASERKVDGLIVDSSFPSAAAMARLLYPMLPTWMMSVKLDNAAKVKSLTMPKLFFHSTQDQVVPFRLGQQLFQAAAEPKTFVELRGSHSEAHEESLEVFVHGLEKFLKENHWL